MTAPLRLMLFDNTYTPGDLQALHRRFWFVPRGLVNQMPWLLATSWQTGGRLFQGVGQLDASRGISSWAEGLQWLAEYEPDRPIAEIQYWGHGHVGRALVGRESLDVSALAPTHPLHPWLATLAERMTPDAQWWFRTCQTLGAAAGHDFAQRWSDFMGSGCAGHTYIIGMWQSGTHRLAPGAKPHWSAWEGIRQGTPEAPVRGWWSHPTRPNTIHCLRNRVPDGW